MDFRKLRGRIAEYGFTYGDLSKKLGITVTTFRDKMNGRSEWKLSEVYALIVELEIPVDEIGLYFFTPKTSINIRKKVFT